MNTSLRFVFSMAFLIFSCRQIPENEEVERKNISYNEPISIKINFYGVDYTDNSLENVPVGENNSGGGG